MAKTPYWTGVIERAIERKREGKPAFTKKQVKLANLWVTCACGKQDPRLPRKSWPVDEPRDRVLSELGMEFNTAVLHNGPIKAKRILSKIEKRSAEILSALDAGGQGGGQ